MRSIKTFMTIMLAIIVTSLTLPALAEEAASALNAPTEMACPLITTPDQSAEVLAHAVIHRMSPAPGADHASEFELMLTETAILDTVLPFGGADGHSAATGIRAWQT